MLMFRFFLMADCTFTIYKFVSLCRNLFRIAVATLTCKGLLTFVYASRLFGYFFGVLMLMLIYIIFATRRFFSFQFREGIRNIFPVIIQVDRITLLLITALLQCDRMLSCILLKAHRSDAYIITIQIDFHALRRINIHFIALGRADRIIADGRFRIFHRCVFQFRNFFLFQRRYCQVVAADRWRLFFLFLLQLKGNFGVFGTYLNILRERIISVCFHMNLMDSVRQFHRTADIRKFTVYAHIRTRRVYSEQNPAGLILYDLDIAYIQYCLPVSFDHHILDTADTAVGKGHLITSLRNDQQHILRYLPDHFIADLDPAADQRLLVAQPQITMSSLHIDTVYLAVDTADRHQILGYDLHRLHTFSF